ncbi:hypothetical protein MWMV2_MWMV2_03669 [Acinetobacter oleivorans]|uniref:hypothetical protein n=1 Tax=Acinetobacter oleivorans TaxID=1148157 RepID=UPI001787328A|nr:hypothetical protein [Acinetobacter oleivorans]CAI3119751.1 hypothetical protein MWMV5_MWMV5_03670 [Acinetobacter oleivorans]CAI3119776.1 hypothetical protein MWMV13_MWMV13_03671 [Acinetobacter oleivorans]CAI3119867.1 hypothetical protein MWMV2_MWMV2_03669 [Acinetobacter oleivorans]CAI3119888.1 hypothetical protein MWMV12_MWMV12_03677 [Acinetobacter oleivorans]CAI3119895.1 hypothetical protein MWMV3_MWMV3_03715 [Acinetobacter oleivorans]
MDDVPDVVCSEFLTGQLVSDLKVEDGTGPYISDYRLEDSVSMDLIDGVVMTLI